MNKAHRSIYMYIDTRDRHWTPTFFRLSWYFSQIQLRVGPYPSKCLPNLGTMLTKNFGFEYIFFKIKHRDKFKLLYQQRKCSCRKSKRPDIGVKNYQPMQISARHTQNESIDRFEMQ